jgi:DNA-binding NtrC family response regulator
MKTILLVKQNIDVANELTKALDDDEFRILPAHNFDEASHTLITHKVDVMICDHPDTAVQDAEFWKLARDFNAQLTTVILPPSPLGQDVIDKMGQALLFKSIIETSPIPSRKLKEVETHRILNELEKEHPGITKVRRDGSGFLILGDSAEE